MAKILVVGGAGYVGSHITKALKNHQVTILDNLSTGFAKLACYGKLIEGDICDRATVNRVLQAVRPDAVFHFAAKTLVGESVTDPAKYFENNIKGSFELIDGVRNITPQAKFIFSSTCSLYGVTDEPLKESDPLAPANPYARTKRMIEEMLEDYFRAYDLDYVALRYFNAAGADSEGKLGELHDPETHLIPRLLLHVKNPQKTPVQIYGEDYPTLDGTPIRDYIHVEDLAAAHVAAMEYLFSDGEEKIFNLGTGRGYSVLEVLKTVEAVTGKKLDLPIAPRRAGDPPRLVSGSEKARKLLHWEPRRDLKEIVETAWSFTLKNRE